MDWQEKVKKIRLLNLSIYDPLPSEELFFTISELQQSLSATLLGLSLAGMPLRTRSKFFKLKVCEALGYIVPASFRRCQPRFLNQNLDTYIQKANNLQIWNENISPDRRYVIVKLDEHDTVVAMKIITGDILAKLDTTGTLTQKYQAKIETPIIGVEIFSRRDSIPVHHHAHNLLHVLPLSLPRKEDVMPLEEISQKLPELIKYSFNYMGATQERNRGGHIHVVLCHLLGYATGDDDGKFPDIKNQLIEVKLQTSPTIDLGAISPDDTSSTNIFYEGKFVRHCDIRYAVFSAQVIKGKAIITGVAIGNGNDFYSRFPQFKGKIINRKIQIPLPDDFFD